ncbi:hypothetical protein CO051_00590 [Candidatus Roizmanbacteria bacterium CG_4_9_14_0_2_um_filter_39_13]|uniref:Uncharacterized protein n=1 Tax=Candidatus Roizmanbacteria bacterium CG_4_9_14_0_2_um_filter_39_13 TaxID=1974839 RepID=A0A2M8F404_9BACT|nr:MAG: hypothetical protein COY15_00005 [Candidatus Roizmanbacteria bacterium CG_4_10_14_0_2_um_filter_39_12]PJC34012.1 MAG: hypothetical protein CO051_00590 [Candidatus Roizmanbacteria bacterium CG_4_9_14_0_2_um_filter_39_13]
MKKTIFIAIIVAVAAFTAGYLTPKSSNNLTENNIKEEPTFYMTDNIACQILESSSQDEIGRQISFINLNTDEPKVLFGEGGTSPMEKVHETGDTLVVQLIASGSGSVDTFVIDKKTGLFSRAATGSFLGVYSIASKGNCK